MNLDGFNAGWSRIGTFFLYAIPLVLGAAACVWLGFAIAGRDFWNQLSQEKRRAIYVGAAAPQKSPLKILTPNTGQLKITRVDLDGSTASVYFENTADRPTRYVRITWQLISPDGTFLASGLEFSSHCGGPDYLGAGEKGEAVLSGYQGIKLDKRAAAIRFEAFGS